MLHWKSTEKLNSKLFGITLAKGVKSKVNIISLKDEECLRRSKKTLKIVHAPLIFMWNRNDLQSLKKFLCANCMSESHFMRFSSNLITSAYFLRHFQCTSDFCPQPKAGVETLTATNDNSQLTIYISYSILHVISLLPQWFKFFCICS